ncbi:MAG: DUF2242 domain-containing protein [Giesbergeria sp.]
MKVIRSRWLSVGVPLLAASLLAACAAPAQQYGLQEKFGSGDMHSRLFDAAPARTCEAGRRALLSQGYLVNTARADLVEGSKSFQPDAESNVQMTIRVVCVPDGGHGRLTLGFVTALQDSYIVKKTNNSASLGVPAIGSLSLPFAASSDSLVKVGSQTITSAQFYDGFFDILKRYLQENPEGEAAAEAR